MFTLIFIILGVGLLAAGVSWEFFKTDI